MEKIGKPNERNVQTYWQSLDVQTPVSRSSVATHSHAYHIRPMRVKVKLLMWVMVFGRMSSARGWALWPDENETGGVRRLPGNLSKKGLE